MADGGVEFGAGFGGGAVDEEDAFRVVEFVLDGAGEEAVGFELDRGAVEDLGFDADGERAGHIGGDFGEAQAAFALGDGFSEGFDFGVEEDHGHVRLEIGGLAVEAHGAGAFRHLGDIEDEHLEREADLLGGEAEAVGVAHGLDHVVRQFLNAGVDFFDAGAGGDRALSGYQGIPVKVAIIDYGSGNLHSAQKAFERSANESGLTASVSLTSDPDLIRKADRIVLPGVGAFADCQAGLTKIGGLIEVLNESVIQKGTPFLGICVGMQILFEAGIEHGNNSGVGIWPATVEKLEAKVNVSTLKSASSFLITNTGISEFLTTFSAFEPTNISWKPLAP